MSKLIVRTVGGFVALMLVLALSLFLPAGSLSFWQAWVYLAIFAMCVILITAYLVRYDLRLLASRVSAGPTAETQKSQRIIQSLASLCFIGLFIVSGLDYRFHWSEVPLAVVVIADTLVVLVFFIVFLVFRENTYTSATIELAEGQKVISSGPYSVVRHPMYVGGSLLLLATPLALGSWVAVPFALAVILVVVVRLLEEEKFLVENLDAYAVYRQKVRYRLIPFIW